MKEFIVDSNKPISVIKGVKRKVTLRYVYLSFIVEAFRSHPLVKEIDNKYLNCRAFEPYQSVLNDFGLAMFKFIFYGVENFRCIDTDEELKVTSAEGKFTISHIFNENHDTFCTD